MPKRPFAMVPLPASRSEKPRRSGLTMIVDAGMPLGQQADLMALAADYVDLAKIKTGSARVYSEPLLLFLLNGVIPRTGRPASRALWLRTLKESLARQRAAEFTARWAP